MKIMLLCLASALFLSPLRSRAESAPAAAEPAAQAAAQKWLALVDAGQAVESRLATAAPMREAIGEWKWKLGFNLAQMQYGACTGRKLRSSSFSTRSPGGRNGEFVELEYDSRSTKKGAVVEKMTVMHEADGQWRIVNYRID